MGLRRVSALRDYDYPGYAYDVTGWTVRTQVDDAKVGKVDDLVVAEDGEPRYLDVDLGFLKKHVLVPLEHAHADAVDEVILVERMSAADFESVPALTHDPADLTLDYERRLTEAYRTGEADVSRGALGDRTSDQLVRLDGMDGFHIRGEDDPRGWKVIGGDGGVVGKAADLLIDRESLRAAYLLVEVDEKGHRLERIGRHLLIPIERVRLTDNHRVLVDGLFARDVGRYPVYGGLPVPDDALDRIGNFFQGLIGADAALADVGTRPYGTGPARHPRAFFGTSSPTAGRGVEERDVLEERGPLGTREDLADRDFAEREVVRARDVDRDIDTERERVVATPVADRPATERPTRVGDAVTLESGDREIRIRLRGDDIVIERRPSGERPPVRSVEREEIEPEPPVA